MITNHHIHTDTGSIQRAALIGRDRWQVHDSHAEQTGSLPGKNQNQTAQRAFS